MKHKNTKQMKTMKRAVLLALFVAFSAHIGKAQTTITVDTGMNWVAYMNVFDSVGVNYMFGSAWALPDVKTIVDPGNGSMNLHPNFSTWNTNDPYWYNSVTGKGNKTMEANTYVEDTTLMGQNLTFQGFVDTFTLDPAYVSYAFIKVLDKNNNYATVLFKQDTITATGAFSVADSIPNLPGMLTQYGFAVYGINADPALESTLGKVVIRGNNAPPMPMINVTFRVQAADSMPVYVFGSWTNFGNWPGDTMASIGNDTYERTLSIPGNQPIEFLYVHGVGPTKEAMDSTAACTNMNSQYTNRLATLGTADTTICFRWETCASCVPVGIKERTKLDMDVLVSTNYINVLSGSLVSVDGLEIMDLTGRTVFSAIGPVPTNERINLNLKKNTFYIIRVTKEGVQHTVKSLIVD